MRRRRNITTASLHIMIDAVSMDVLCDKFIKCGKDFAILLLEHFTLPTLEAGATEIYEETCAEQEAFKSATLRAGKILLK